MTGSRDSWTRRAFLGRAGSCTGHLALLAAAPSFLPARQWAAQERYPIVAREKWGRIHWVAEGVWALVSTPLQDRTTLCNGGIVAGRTGVVVVEAYGSDAGAAWMAQQARALTGRAPTHVVLTHYHGDHTGGLRGACETEGIELLATGVTRDEVAGRNKNPPADLLKSVVVLDERRPTEIDLGDRSILIVPRRGHTDSDVSLEMPELSVVFCGDLMWNHMFPNYMDAIPTRLTQNVRLLGALGATTYIPGHGPLADAVDMRTYQTLLDDVEAAARRGVERGMSAEDAGKAYRVPEALGEWMLFDPSYFATAIGAWMRELKA